MRQKKLVILSFIVAGCSSFLSNPIYGQKTSSDKILFTQLLDSISTKYGVFFTYNSASFDKKQVAVSFLKRKSLRKTLHALEKDTSYYFDNLGNKYYVVYSKEPSTDTSLQKGIQLSEVVITGNRTKSRTILNSPNPIDNIYLDELKSSGKNSLDEMLTYKIPSFNSQNQAISDATAHYNPADLRGLGPSRMLVLINGKRKNQSAQVYLNRTPGKGEVGVDLHSIPTAAIERIEILRDGASAQYGSDAIAGVINIILKKKVPASTFSASTGITAEKDGFNFSSDFNTSFNTSKEGFINLTLGYYNQKSTNRAGTPGVDDLPTNPLSNWVQWATENPDLGMNVGQPDMEKKELFINTEHPLNEDTSLYSFHGFTARNGRSFAYYRAPYWRQTDVGDTGFLGAPEDFIGYQPTFEAEIKDYINAIGVSFSINEVWNADASITYGSNSIFYTINNSVNKDYLRDHGTSPRTFKPGGYKLTNTIGSFDVTGLISKQLSIALGLEYKMEKFKGFEGDSLSYYKQGSDSFVGIKPDEAGIWRRSNFAGYIQVDYDINDTFLLGIASRYENFTDFGSNYSWKISSRYKLGNKGVLRASFSTGFRAPTLHQRHLTTSQYVQAGSATIPILQRTLANNNPAIKALEVPRLFAETSRNASGGFTYKLHKRFFASVDFYQIKINDRVLFSSQIGYKNGSASNITNPVEQILKDNTVETIQFFINAGDTKTSGADLILNYKDLYVGGGKMHVNFAANFNKTTINTISTPVILANAGYTIFDRQEQGLITNARPKSKMVLGFNYVNKKWDASLNNTRFGKVIITAPETGGIDQELSAKTTTDLGFRYHLTSKTSLNTYINNIFDVYPDKTLKTTKTAQAGSRFVYSSEVQQLGQLGANFSVGLNYVF
jgi:iron complex outermembrane receptor protein